MFSDILKLANTFYSFAADRREYMREYMAKRYHDKRNSVIQDLGNKCSKCGIENVPFDIDHIDASKKTMRASDIHSISDEKVKKEKENFQLLCIPCHKNKTKEEWDYGVPEPTHGTIWMRRKYKCNCDLCKQVTSKKKEE